MMEGTENKCGGHCKCGCMHHKVMPVLIILFGLAFLGNIWWGWPSSDGLQVIWPILVVIVGLKALFVRRCQCC